MVVRLFDRRRIRDIAFIKNSDYIFSRVETGWRGIKICVAFEFVGFDSFRQCGAVDLCSRNVCLDIAKTAVSLAIHYLGRNPRENDLDLTVVSSGIVISRIAAIGGIGVQGPYRTRKG